MCNEVPNNVVVRDVVSKGGIFTNTTVGTVMIGGIFFYAIYSICRNAVKEVTERQDKEFKRLNKKLMKTIKKFEKKTETN